MASDAIGVVPQDGTDQILLDSLSEDEIQLLTQGLYALRERKVEALAVIQSPGMRMYGQTVDQANFGIPQIDKLLRRLGEG